MQVNTCMSSCARLTPAPSLPHRFAACETRLQRNLCRTECQRGIVTRGANERWQVGFAGRAGLKHHAQHEPIQ